MGDVVLALAGLVTGVAGIALTAFSGTWRYAPRASCSDASAGGAYGAGARTMSVGRSA